MVKGRLGCGSAQEWLKGRGPLVWRRTFPGRTDQIREARRLAAMLFAGSGREDDVSLIVTELCSNAVLYTRSNQPGGWFGLELVLDDLAYVAVADLGGAGIPSVPSRPALHNEPCLGGRGLFLASELAFTMGVHGSPAVGHTVWADIDMHAQPHTEQDGTPRLIGEAQPGHNRLALLGQDTPEIHRKKAPAGLALRSGGSLPLRWT